MEAYGIKSLGNVKPSEALEYLPLGYKILNYSFTIEGCSLSTFHRDVTSSHYVFKTRHPTYTFIKYYYAGPQIPFLPGSHRSTPFAYSSPVTVTGESRDGYLFNCDLVHAGAMGGPGPARLVKQYKLIHSDDERALGHLNNVHTVKRGKCDISPAYETLSRHLSIMFSRHIFKEIIKVLLAGSSSRYMAVRSIICDL